MNTTLLRGGTIILPEFGPLEADLLIAGEKVAGLFQPGWAPTADVTVDVGGKVIFPGLIEPHAHLGYGSPEDYFTETRSAALGGVTTVLSFNWTLEPYDRWLKEQIAAGQRQAFVDFGFHLGLMNEDQLAGLDTYCGGHGVSSFKFYMQYMGEVGARRGVRMTERFMVDVLEAIGRRQNMAVCVHAESPGLFEPLMERGKDLGENSLVAWTATRPAEAEKLALTLLLRAAREKQCPVYIVHLSSADGLDEIKATRANGQKVYVETCPHYLTHFQDDPLGHLLKVAPPVRTSEDAEALWAAVLDGTVDTIGSDHISRTAEEKRGNIWSTPGGFQGAGTMLPVLLTEGYRKRGLSLKRVAQLTSANAARIFNLYPKKGTLLVGSDADLTVVDLDEVGEVRASELGSRSDFSIYEGWSLYGWPQMTMCRGRWIQRERVVDDDASGWGRYLPRKTSG